MLKVCIIGGSGIYGYVLDGLDTRTSLVGVAPGSANEDTAKLHASLNSKGLQPQIFTDWQDMLDATRPDIVAVHCHHTGYAPISMACMARGIHVFSEKPVAASLAQLAELKAAYTNSGVKFCANFSSRYKPWFRALEAALRAGEIGEVRGVQAQKSYRLGNRPDFYRHRASYGGTIPWIGSHPMDWIPWLTRERYESVYATHSQRHNFGYGELEVSAQCQFTLSNEVCASVSIDFLHPAAVAITHDDRIRVVGTKGVLEIRDKQAWLLNAKSRERQCLETNDEQSIFRDFVSEVMGEGYCDIRPEDAFVCAEACLKAQQSADERRLIHFGEAKEA